MSAFGGSKHLWDDVWRGPLTFLLFLNTEVSLILGQSQKCSLFGGSSGERERERERESFECSNYARGLFVYNSDVIANHDE